MPSNLTAAVETCLYYCPSTINTTHTHAPPLTNCFEHENPGQYSTQSGHSNNTTLLTAHAVRVGYDFQHVVRRTLEWSNFIFCYLQSFNVTFYIKLNFKSSQLNYCYTFSHFLIQSSFQVSYYLWKCSI